MATRLFTSALFAGLTAGLIAALLQFTLMEPLILEGEEYESGALVHFAGVPGSTADHHANDDDHHADDDPLADDTDHHANDEQNQGVNVDESDNLTTRFGLAFFADFIVFVGWGLFMVAGFSLAENYGHRVTQTNALLWGGAGFIAVHLAPGIGLPPELPGIPAADLQARQIWWIATVLSAVVALALIAYGRGVGFTILGLALLVVPHIIGVPQLDQFTGLAPPELSAEFVARSNAVAMATWLTLGIAAGYFWNRNQASEAT